MQIEMQSRMGGSEPVSRNAGRMKTISPFASLGGMNEGLGMVDFHNDLHYAHTIGAGGGEDLFKLHLEPTIGFQLSTER